MESVGTVLETPARVLDAARAQRAVADQAEARILALACDWADLHPASPGEADAFDDPHLPAVAWDAPAEFALAIGTTHDAGARLIHQALELRHRLPRLWARTMAAGTPHGLQSWRARRIAEHTIAHPDDVATHLDATLAPLAHQVGPVTTHRLLHETLTRLHPVQSVAEHDQAMNTRHATIRPLPQPTGMAYLEATGDLKDFLDLNHTLATIAAILATQGNTAPLDVRRSQALGILADPHHAAHLLTTTPGALTTTDSDSGRRPRLRKQLVLYVHLSHTALANPRSGAGALGRLENLSLPVLSTQIRDWCSRTDTHLTVQPVIDLNDHLAVDRYEIPERLHEQTTLREVHCAFPRCTRPARTCDHDHTAPHAQGGRPCASNHAPLCPRHHPRETHTRWTYTP
ncbi:HNH endonuclease signature motif containing protein, partial [Nocardioides sp.]|uniref:HNH endonuclease signature motif containing protein n=1 Tax=Nocardioides sp. TaxID=35761 RepID=UPI003D149F47